MNRLSGKAGNVFVADKLIENCEDAWDEQVIGNVTASADSTSGNYKVGSASAKFAVGADFITGLIGSEAIASLDLSAYAQLMAWVKSSVSLAANDWNIRLDNTANNASPEIVANIPALSAGIWKLIKVAADLSGCTAIISVGLGQAIDKGAMNFWIDELRAAKQVAGIKSWTLDQIMEVLEATGFDSGGYKAYIPSIASWSGSFEGFKEGAPLTIGSIYHLELRESATATQQYRGSAIITGLHIGTTVDGLVTYLYDFQGTAELEIASS